MVFGQLRNLHETWRRVAFLKLSPKVAVPYFKLPSMSPVRQDGSIRSTHIRLDPALIEKAVRKSGSDRDKKFWDLSSAGFSHFHGGAHPSSEGLLQLVSESDDKLIFGPNYNADLCAFCLEWGIAGLIMLLHEIDELVPQSPEWRGSLEVLSNQYSDWLERYNREFVFGRRVRFVFDLPFRSSDASTDFDAATLHVLSPEQVGERIRGHYAFMLRLGGTSEIALKITARYGALYDLSVEDVSSCLLADQFKSHKDTGET